MRTTATTLSIATTLLAGRASAEQIAVANLAVEQLLMTADHCAVIGAVNDPVLFEGLLYLIATAASEQRLITVTVAVLLDPYRLMPVILAGASGQSAKWRLRLLAQSSPKQLLILMSQEQVSLEEQEPLTLTHKYYARLAEDGGLWRQHYDSKL